MSMLNLPPMDSPTMIVLNLVCVFVLAILLVRWGLNRKRGKSNARNNNHGNNTPTSGGEHHAGDNVPR